MWWLFNVQCDVSNLEETIHSLTATLGTTPNCFLVKLTGATPTASLSTFPNCFLVK